MLGTLGCLQIQKVQVERSTPHYLLDHKGDILAFDVSRHGTHFALLRRNNELMVDVYEEKDRKCKHVAGYTFDDKRGTGDVCFYVPMAVQREIGEILVVADYSKNQLLLLDYMSGCGHLETINVNSPVSLAKNPDGRLWLNCKVSGEKSEILCF
ncbi:hypothetical protein V1264_000478 [Littorina saxatilis]|uniref:Uncharacterized protein n=1 Tax=Littorina saxatilis TaxID=31220 RepID=A0AAN9C4R9_9CAEN